MSVSPPKLSPQPKCSPISRLSSPSSRQMEVKPEVKQEIDEASSSFTVPASESSSAKKTKSSSSSRAWAKLDDPNAPKKPRSAYVLFLSSRRSQYGTVKQGFDQKTINLALAAEWRALGEDDRKKFYAASERERIDYTKAMATYQKTPEYLEFTHRKELILKQRKQLRKIHGDDHLLSDVSVDKGPVSPKKSHKKKPEKIECDVIPTVPNSNIPIFSKEFVDHNRERENELRQLRRLIGVAEDEQASMKKTIERIQTNYDELKTQLTEDETFIRDASLVMTSWIQTATKAFASAGIKIDSSLISSPELTADFFAKLAEGAPEQTAKYRSALHNVSFVLPKH